MDHRQLVLDTINHTQREVLPFHLDLTEEVRLRLIDYFQDEDFERKVGNSLLLRRNESFTHVDEKRKRDMFGVLWLSLYEGLYGFLPWRRVIFKDIETKRWVGGYTSKKGLGWIGWVEVVLQCLL